MCECVCSPGVVHSAQTQSRLFSKDVYIQKKDGGRGGGLHTARATFI